MKAKIMGFNQAQLCEKYVHLNCNDIAVLRTIVDMIPIMDVKIRKHEVEYSWIMYKLLIKNLPFITQSESTMKKIVQKLIDAGLIERLIINQGGKYTYFRKTESCRKLESDYEEVNESEFEQYEEQEQIKNVNKILTEKISETTIDEIIKNDDVIINKAIEACKEKERVTNAYFVKAIKIASQKKIIKKDNLRFINFEAREYDYDRLEKKLLGWEDDSNEVRDYRK